MNSFSRSLVLLAVLFSALLSASAARAQYYDPPGRVARLSDVRGELSYSPAGEDEWYGIHRNRPLARGDRLWSDRGSRAELQLGSTAIRIGEYTSLDFLELSDRFVQLQLSEGSINVRVRRMYPGQEIEIATPGLAFVIRKPGTYRIDVEPEYDDTTITVWRGDGVAYGEGDRFAVRAGDAVRFYGSDLRDYELYGLPPMDDFDRYAIGRDRRMDQSVALRYLSDDIVGYSDLDAYGSWRTLPGYGNAWFPSQVGSDWAPYSDGQWIWQEPWGWTWVDNAAWGFAPSHYGRWVYANGRWGWLPGPRTSRPTYAPALVVFIGGGQANIGWFPLGPRDVYVPPYQTSREYFSRVNQSNTVVNADVLSQAYGSYASGKANPNRVNYANRAVPTAVTAVPARVFSGARPVRGAGVRMDRNAIANAPVSGLAPIAPSAQSVQGPQAAPATKRPPREALQRQVFVRTAPPAPPPAFAQRERQLEQRPGRPLAPPAADAAPRQQGQRNFRVLRNSAAGSDARAAGPRQAPPAAPTAAAPATTAPSAPTAAAPATPELPAAARPQLDRSSDRPRRRARMNEQGAVEPVRPSPRPMPPVAAPPAAPPAAAPPPPTPPVAAPPPPPEPSMQQRQAEADARAEAQAKARAEREAQMQAREAERAKARADADAAAQARAEARAAAEAKAAADAKAAAEAQAAAAPAPPPAAAPPVENTPQQDQQARREARRAARDAARKPEGCLFPNEVAAAKQRSAATGEPMPEFVACEAPSPAQ